MPKKQADGRYRAKITVGHTADGTPIFKYVSGRTRPELEKAKLAAIAYYVDGTAGQADRLFCEYAIEWYRVQKKPHLSASSRDSYRSMLNKHILPAFEGRMLRAVTANNAQEFVNQFTGKSDTTITQVITILRGVFKSAFADGIIHRDITTTLKKPKSKPADERRALTDSETAAILKTIERHPDGPMLAAMYYLGTRRGETLGLQWGDFDWDASLVHIQRDIDFKLHRSEHPDGFGEVKTEAAVRHVVIPDELHRILYPMRGLPAALVFPSPSGRSMGQSTFEKKWLSLMQDAGLVIPRSSGKKWSRNNQREEWQALITPHMLRHNYITRMYEAGIDPLIAMKLVGHKDYRTTAGIYTHLTKAHIEKASGKINKVFSKKVAEKLPRQQISKNTKK